MAANKKPTAPISKASPTTKVQGLARKKLWIDPDDIPDQSGVPIEQWTARIKGVPVKRGRPVLETPKKLVSIRLDADLVERLRGSGAGWQSRVNTMLRQTLKI